MKLPRYPSVTIVIPVRNEEKNLQRLFASFQNQTYPKNKIEYLVIDDGSTDGTFAMAKKFGAKVISVSTGDIGENKRIGLARAKNELVYCIDADIELCSIHFFERLVKPFDDQHIIGSFTNEFSFEGGRSKVANSLLRCLSYNPTQQDPLCAFLSPQIADTVVQKNRDYFLCTFASKIPAVGRIMYRRKEIQKIQQEHPDMIMDLDLDTTALVAKTGNNLFAYVPAATLRHYHALSLSQFIRKRARNLGVNYLPQIGKKSYLWFDLESRKDILKLFLWFFWTNLFVPEFIVGCYYMLKFRDAALLWRPILAIAATDTLLFRLLTLSSGRKVFLSEIRKFSFVPVIFLLSFFFFLTFTSSLSESPTTDEPGFIINGLLYMKYGNLVFNSGSPILPNIISTVPLIAFGPNLTIPTEPKYFQQGNVHDFAKYFLLLNKVNIDTILLLTRLPMMIVGTLLGFFIFFWAKRWYGYVPALLALALYVSEPSFLAHSHYAATDVPFALLFIMTLFFLERYVTTNRTQYLILFIISFVLSQLTKITAIFLFPLTFFIFYWYSTKTTVFGKIMVSGRMMVILILLSIFAINAFYGFRDIGLPLSYYLTRDQAVKNSPYSKNLIQFGLPSYFYTSIPLPISYQYVKTLGWAAYVRSKIPEPAFLAGRYFNTGWKLYFPVTILFKMSLGLLMFLAISLFLHFNQKKQFEKRELVFVVMPLALFMGIMLFSRVNSGYRLMLFLVPLFILFAVRFVSKMNRLTYIFILIALFQLAITISNFPNFLGYANFIDPRNKYKYLTDSNVDWGQDVKRLSMYLKDNKINTIHMNLFGVMDTEIYGKPYNRFGPSWIKEEGVNENCQNQGWGVYAISASQLNGTFLDNHACFVWLLKKGTLLDVVGSSIYIYSVP